MPAESNRTDPEGLSEYETWGRLLVPSVLRWHGWCHRKVESLELLEGERARRRVSVDCTPPKLKSDLTSRQVPIPLTWIGKGQLRNFDVADASGQSLPVLGRRENAAVAIGLIMAILEGEEMDASLGETNRSIRSLVADVCLADASDAQEAARRIRQMITLGELSDLLLSAATECFLLLVLIPVEMCGSRQVIKYSYHWEAATALSGHSRRTLASNMIAVAERAPKEVLAALGLRSQRIELELAAVDTAASYHLEVPCPQGLLSTGLESPDLETLGVSDKYVSSVAHVHGTYESYLHDPAARFPVRLDLSLSSTGPIGAVTLAAVGTAAIFVLAWALPGAMETLAERSDGASSLLLFGPALLFAVMVRPGENVVTSRIYRPLRGVAVLLSILLFIAGASLVGQLNEPWMTFLWRGSAIVSGLIAILLVAGTVRLSWLQRQSSEAKGVGK